MRPFSTPSARIMAVRVGCFRLFAVGMVCAASLVLVACDDEESRVNPALLPAHAIPVEPDPVGLRLAQAAEQATVAQNRMSHIEAFRTPMPELAAAGAPPPAYNQYPTPPYPISQAHPGMGTPDYPPSMAFEEGPIQYQPIAGMEIVTSLTWTGPIEQITRTLAEMAGLIYETSGKEPPLPIIVQVDAHQQPVGKILQDIGLQAGRRADIIVDTLNRTLDLRYAPNDGILTQY